jgi:hypothetical protein
MTAGDFYRDLIGFPNGPSEISEWIRAPEENLAMSVNGAVFTDNLGSFSAVRRYLLGFYPEELRKKRIAARCMALAQTGQYNHMRIARRSDWVTVRHTLARFHDAAVAMVFLLNRVYRPYYKWAFRMMTGLPILGSEVAGHLRELALASDFSDNGLSFQRGEIESVCGLFTAELRRQMLSSSPDGFLVSHGEEIQRGIKDKLLAPLPPQVYV